MENPIKDNRLVCDKTFATRLLSFTEQVKVNDACSEDERDSFISYAAKLLEYQCITATDKDEISYLEMVGVYKKFTQPFLTTEDNYVINKYDDIKIYSCLKKPNKGEQVLHYPLRKIRDNQIKINSNRVYFKVKENCINYIDMNIPMYSKQDLLKLNLLNEYNSSYIFN